LYTSAGPRTCQNYTGSWGYFQQDARLFASWGVDFLKLDSCHQFTLEDREIAFSQMSAALLNSGRPILFSCCTPELMVQSGNKEWPWIWAPPKCNMARIWWDIGNTWSGSLQMADHVSNIGAFNQPGYWNDMDILTVGMRPQSPAEWRSMFSLWVINASPLIAGNDVRSMNKTELDILTHDEMIAINQDKRGIGANVVWRADDGQREVWARPIIDNVTHAVVMLNRGSQRSPFTLHFNWLYGDFLCCPPPKPTPIAFVRDIWARKDLGQFTASVNTNVEAHDVVVMTVKKLN